MTSAPSEHPDTSIAASVLEARAIHQLRLSSDLPSAILDLPDSDDLGLWVE